MDIEYRLELPEKEDLYALYEHLEWNQYLKLNQDQLIDAMKGSSYSVYAYSGGRLIGTGRVVSDGTISAFLCGLGVHRAFRRQGIGTAIMKKLCRFCADNNLHVQFFCEEHLIPYYERIGFVRFAGGMKTAKENCIS